MTGFDECDDIGADPGPRVFNRYRIGNFFSRNHDGAPHYSVPGKKILKFRWLRKRMRRFLGFVLNSKKEHISTTDAGVAYQTMMEDDQPIISAESRRTSQEDLSTSDCTKKAKKSKQKRIRKVLIKSCHYMGVGVSQMAPGIAGAIGGGHVITPVPYTTSYNARYQMPSY